MSLLGGNPDQGDAKRNDRKNRRESEGLYKSLRFRLNLEEIQNVKKASFFVLKNLDPQRQSKNLWFQSTTKSKIERSRLRFV